MSKFRIKRRYPNYVSGFEETENEVDTIEELKEIDWVKKMINNPNHHSLAIDKEERRDDIPHSLMTVTHYDEEYGGCKLHWVVGYIWGDDVDDLGLPEWTTMVGNHKEGCPQKKWQHDECNCGFR
jgi:hypothetical protein